MRNVLYMNTPIGNLKLVEEENYIIEVSLLKENDVVNTNKAERLAETERIVCENCDSSFLSMAKKQVEEYFSGERKLFTLPLAPKGTAFQEKVWEALLKIPYGETRTYKEIAMQIGNEKACRAVGMANNRNPIMILIPCHRVIGANGAMVGYGAGILVKEYLLNLEQCEKNF